MNKKGKDLKFAEKAKKMQLDRSKVSLPITPEFQQETYGVP